MDPQKKAVLFVDVSGSTAFFERYGEVAGHAMVQHCFKVIVPAVEQHAGRIVKYMGDGFLAVFDDVAAAIEAGAAMQSSLADDNATRPDAARVRIHSGISSGAVVVRDDGDIYGDPVNVAARVQHVAGPDQVYVTKDAVDELLIEAKAKTRRVGQFALRGKEDEVELYEVMWKLEGATMLFTRAALREEAMLSVFFQGTTVELGVGQSRLTVGRIVGNDLVVDDGAVSREHAEFVRRKGSIYLIDRSTNGTYVRPSHGKERHLHREEFMLDGSGEVLLGRPNGPPLEYKVS
ncbi:MAG TPA: adenylate/guanylate cyclase domain-containing protein [Candidatus Binatia bacterium]|nr:adenylate/guanylate cyclase domain-containing protein [Candidatus Binatia bacterium]